MRAIQYIFIILIASTLFSCEKDVTVQVPEAEEQIVVEGYIQTDTLPYVILSRTLPFFGEISTSDIRVNTVTGAKVYIDDGISVDTFFQIIPDLGVYIGHNFGVAGKTYKLTVEVEGKTITSVTNIPHPLALDSVWWKPEGTKDSLGFAWAHMTDPDTIGNCYRWFAQRINKYTYGDDVGEQKDSTFIAPQGSSFEDKFINTKSFDFSFPRGAFIFSEKEDDENDERFYFKRGDTIIVKFCTIDRATFEFVRTEEGQVQNNGNPFGSPAPITSNITGGLGVWAGYAPSYDTIIAQ